MTESIQPLLTAGPAWERGTGEVVIRMRVAESWDCSPGEAPPVVPVSDEQVILCPSGFTFEGEGLTTTRISGYSDGWSYVASVCTAFTPVETGVGRLRMTVAVESLEWTGPQSVAHPMRGSFDLIYSENVVLRCSPWVA